MPFRFSHYQWTTQIVFAELSNSFLMINVVDLWPQHIFLLWEILKFLFLIPRCALPSNIYRCARACWQKAFTQRMWPKWLEMHKSQHFTYFSLSHTYQHLKCWLHFYCMLLCRLRLFLTRWARHVWNLHIKLIYNRQVWGVINYRLEAIHSESRNWRHRW